jgi:hypothetical protein
LKTPFDKGIADKTKDKIAGDEILTHLKDQRVSSFHKYY